MDYQKNQKFYKKDAYFLGDRPEMLALLPKESQRVLEVGCGSGVFGGQIPCEVWGVEPAEEFAQQAAKRLHKVLVMDIEDALSLLPDHYFDAVYFNDVLEHLLDPYSVLEKMRQKLTPRGVVISSIPNIRYFRTLGKLVWNKEWQYEEQGILDITHLRFFTVKSILKMYENAGYEVIFHRGIRPSKSLKPLLLNLITLGSFPDIKYQQFATVARLKS